MYSVQRKIVLDPVVQLSCLLRDDFPILDFSSCAVLVDKGPVVFLKPSKCIIYFKYQQLSEYCFIVKPNT